MKLKKILIAIIYILMVFIYIINMFINKDTNDIDKVLPTIEEIEELY